MANKRISDFTTITNVGGSDLLLIDQAGTTYNTTIGALTGNIGNNFILKPATALNGQILTYNGTAWVAVGTGASLKTWVNFNGTNTVSIRGSANVSSITDNGIGDYTVNFITAMPDANFAVLCTADGTTGAGWTEILPPALGGAQTASSIRVGFRGTTAYGDTSTYCVAVFR